MNAVFVEVSTTATAIEDKQPALKYKRKMMNIHVSDRKIHESTKQLNFMKI